MNKTIRIGTRGSALALFQANRVKQTFEALDESIKCQIKVIITQGDIDLVTPLHAMGGKSAFVRNLEIALYRNEIDIAVHSLKDITSRPLDGLELTGFLAAEAVTDVLILKHPYKTLQELPANAVIATGSLRRKAILKKLKPEIQTADIRGNVHTRLQKLENGQFEGVMLSEAGLMRLNLSHCITQRFTPDVFCPAPGQGVIVMQTRSNDAIPKQLCHSASDTQQMIKSRTELAFLERLEFDCHAPLGAHAMLSKDQIQFKIFLANSSMDKYFEKDFTFTIGRGYEYAVSAAEEVLQWLTENE